MARADPPRRSHPLTFFLHNLKQRPYGRCFFYTLNPTPRIKNIFGIIYVFFFISRRAYIYVYLPPPARVRTLSIHTRSINAVRHLNSRQAIHAKPTRRQESKQPSGYTLRLRLYTPYTAAASINGHTASPIGSLYGSSQSPGRPRLG